MTSEDKGERASQKINSEENINKMNSANKLGRSTRKRHPEVVCKISSDNECGADTRNKHQKIVLEDQFRR